ncbi:NUDIX hydrolase [Clostridium sp. D2Q-11]|uniref:NUDIX hydrolase n=1 Tax=Anaeromonas frigoriresistens TaxID=2683708 RepID=A0A942Z7V3_9FIRM|nr:NUDIX hydrolase [Anaeromonas frigoriresistens]MBS4537294.1 NUDIX hydrolase [Anaeromonas frigoriresistens]
MKQFPTHIVAVDGIVENEKNEILLVKHRDKEIWTIPGGQVEIGENLTDALIREIKEESGIDVTVNKLVCISSNTGTYEGYNGYGIVPTKVMLGFTCSFIGGELSVSDETSDSRWVSKERVLDYITNPNLIERFKAYLKFDGNIQYIEYITKPSYDLKLKIKI